MQLQPVLKKKKNAIKAKSKYIYIYLIASMLDRLQ